MREALKKASAVAAPIAITLAAVYVFAAPYTGSH
jgi:hypothetical protein